MKKISLVLVTILLVPMMFLNVYAASAPYEWIVDGETINTESNEAGTARVEKEGKKITLFLKNYDGGKLELHCYGTGQSDMEFIINLEGDNKVTASDVGIAMENSKVKFEGEGSLIITAPKPISSEDYEDEYKVNVKETQKEETKEEKPQLIMPEKDDIAPPEEFKERTEKMDKMVRTIGSTALVLIVVISFIVVRTIIKNKKENQE